MPTVLHLPIVPFLKLDFCEPMHCFHPHFASVFIFRKEINDKDDRKYLSYHFIMGKIKKTSTQSQPTLMHMS